MSENPYEKHGCAFKSHEECEEELDEIGENYEEIEEEKFGE